MKSEATNEDGEYINPNFLVGVTKLLFDYYRLEDDEVDEYIEDMWGRFIDQNRKCGLSGMLISFKDGTASVDRIDSNVGYINTNIMVVHKDINRMKGALADNYFIELCNNVCLANRYIVIR